MPPKLARRDAAPQLTADDVEALAGAQGRRRGAFARAGARWANSPFQTVQVFRTAVSVARDIGTSFLQTLATLLVLFIIHQLFVWVDRDPEAAFDRGALLFEVAEITWDTSGIFYNAAIDILNSGVIPLWNAASFYIVEPLFAGLLEIFSLMFAKKHWTGLYDEDEFPYVGLDCTATAQAAARRLVAKAGK